MSTEDLNDEFEIEIEDDTPIEDKGRTPMPEHIVEDLEHDELDAYDGAVKERMSQLKKVWHDERRAKESAERERQEAVEVAKRLYEENKRIKGAYNSGEEVYINTAVQAGTLKVEAAKRAYKEAYEAGDPDALVEAQNDLQLANLELLRAKGMKPAPLQDEEDVVQRIQETKQPQTAPEPDKKALAWQKRNKWFGEDEEMTAAALGLHEKLKNNGVEVGSDEYYDTLDKTMRRRFGEYFQEEPKPKPSSVVAPATRSTSPNKVRLTPSQVQLSKKLGITPEQYARELIKLEKANG